MANAKDLDVYKRAYGLALQIHKFSFSLPRELHYDLGDQIRRASRSIPSNIVEGLSRRQTSKEKTNFLRYALGSNDEVLFNLEFMKDTGLLKEELYTQLKDDYIICGKQLLRLIQHVSTSN